PRVLLQPKTRRPPVGAPPPVRTEQAPTTQVAPFAPDTGAPTTQNTTPPCRSTAPGANRAGTNYRGCTHSHPTRVLLQAARPCRSTAPGANAPLVLNLFLMLLIQ